MAQTPITAGEQAVIVGEELHEEVAAPDEKEMSADEKLVHWVISRVRSWKDHRNANYANHWDAYERAWRAIYSDEDKNKKRERSKLISPATAEAVENGVSEIEEAVFGRGDFLDILPSADDSPIEQQILDKNEALFRSDLNETDLTSSCSETVLNGAVYGTGIAEIILEKSTRRDIRADVGPDGGLIPSVQETEMERPVLRSVNPRNFIIDPAARCIEDALGVAIEEDVGEHLIREGITKGTYRKVVLEVGAGDTETKADPQMETAWVQDVVATIRYYGKVPTELLFPKEKTENLFPDEKQPETDLSGDMTEAWVVIANESQLLMAKATPDMMKDRPVLAFQWDIVPGRFWGRGICEKGYTSQRMLDAELRYRIDCLAFVAAPMIAMDASRLPRGFKFDIYPGKNILLNGDPNTILKTFKFGELDANSGQQIELLDRMVQRATGSVDGMSLARSGVGGEARSGAVSMALSGIVKRNKRTLMRYVNKFLAPAVRKLFWRYVQYNPERYVPVNMTFGISSTMGIMQREYETMSMTQVMPGLQPGTLEHTVVLRGIVSNSGMQGRDQVLAALDQKIELLSQPTPTADPNAPVMDPVMIELQRQDALLSLAEKQAKIAKLNAEVGLISAKTQSELVEPHLESQRIALKGIYETAQDRINAEYDRRLEVARLALDREQMESDERITAMQSQASVESAARAGPSTKIVQVEKPVAVPVPMPLPTVAVAPTVEAA